MIRIAIVDDDLKETKKISEYLTRYAKENSVSVKVSVFHDAVAFLSPYTAEYDIIFMDIKMPYMNGIDAAHRLRALDRTVILIFCTSLVQYAVAGYDVEALFYIVKPVNYYDFALKLSRAVTRLPSSNGAELVVTTKAGTSRFMPEDIIYVEVQGHDLVYHTLNGDYSQYGSLKQVENRLSGLGFSRCNSCYLVNLNYVQDVKGYTVTMKGCELKIGQTRKKAFMRTLNEYRTNKQS